MLDGGTSRKIVTLKAEGVGGKCEDVVWVDVALKMMIRGLPV
jgi:hypothetical protein